MSAEDVSNRSDASGQHAELDEILAELMRAHDRGEKVDRSEWLARHADFASDLQEYFDKQARLESLVLPLREAALNALRVRCPHCHNPMELLERAMLTDISCPSCGSSFSLVGDQKTSAFPLGTETFGHFELREHVGIGQFGSVWKALDTKLDRIVAVKIPRRGQLDETQTELFLRDARAAAQLKHPNIVSVHEVGRQQDTTYIVSDFIDGTTLNSWMATFRPTPREAAELCVKIAKALHHAHESGVIHRDLKPGNIMMDSDAEPHIVDFGLAKRDAGEITMTVEGQILGTPAYMSPEQARGEGHNVDRRADIYSLGVILFESLTGELPFRGDKQMLIVQLLNDEPPSPRKLNNSVPRDLETIVLKCLAKEPGKRYENAQQLADDLERFLSAQPILARPAGRGERTWRWCRRNPVVATLSTISVLLLAAVAVGYFREANLRREVEVSYQDLEAEQKHNRQLSKDVSSLESDVDDLTKRRNNLDASLTEGKLKLKEGDEKLYETYLKLARAAWQQDDVELADFYLDKCPEGQRKTAWHDLKRLCHPQVETFEGRHCVAISKDGKLLAAGSEDNSIKVWQVATGKLMHTLSGHDQSVLAVDFSPDGSMLASGGGKQVLLWDLANGSICHRLENSIGEVTDVAFGSDGRLASASVVAKEPQGEVILWDLTTYQPLRSLPGRRFVVFNHDGSLLASAQVFETRQQRGAGIVVWDLNEANDEPKSNSLVIARADNSCRPAFHPFKNQLAISQGFNSVEFWDIDTKRIIKRFSGEVRVGCLAYNSDGNRLAYTGTTNEFSLRPDTFRTVVWNLITGEKERILPWYSSAVVGAAFSLDGRQLVTADGTSIKIWDVTPPPDPTELILNDIVELDVGKYDWPQWGGSRARINTPAGTNIPTHWNIGKDVSRRIRSADNRLIPNPDFKLGPVVPEGSKNIKWAVPLGSQTYGNPVVANGNIFLGTNNGAGYLKRYRPSVDLGVLLCFDEATGNFRWQHSNEKLPSGRVNDWPLQGVCSTPMVDGDRLWYVSNRGEIVCLDTNGFYDQEDDGVPAEWSTVFADEPMTVACTLDRRILAPAFVDALQTSGESRPLSVVKDKVGSRWKLGVYVREDRDRRRFDQLFIVSLESNRIKVFPYTDQKELEVVEFCSIENDLFPELAQQKMPLGLAQLLEERGYPLDENVEIKTTEQQGQWHVASQANGQVRNFRLNRSGDTLTAEIVLTTADTHEADVVWKFDMIEELGVFPHNMATCSVITADGLLFVCTSNGVDESHLELPSPRSPSFLALDRDTGELIWEDNSPGQNIMHAQWASPSYGVFDGQAQVIFPGGDGWVYSFDPHGDGQGRSKLLWKFDGNPKTSRWYLGGRGSRNNIIAFPAIYDGLVYIVMGQDPEHGEGSGHLWCIDPKKRMDGSDVSAELSIDSAGNVIPHRGVQAVDIAMGERAVPNPSSAVVWHYSYQDQDYDERIEFNEEFHRTLSIPVIKDDILYIGDIAGLFHCLHAKTGRVYWTHDLLSSCWGSALLVDGKVYMGSENGTVTVFRHSADPGTPLKSVQTSDGETQLVPVATRWQGDVINKIDMLHSIYMTPIVANNVMYIATRNTLYAIAETPESR